MISEHMTGRVHTHCVEGEYHIPKIHFPSLAVIYVMQVYYVQPHKCTHTSPDIGWVSVCPRRNSASTGMTSVDPAGKGNFHTERQQASQAPVLLPVQKGIETDRQKF